MSNKAVEIIPCVQIGIGAIGGRWSERFASSQAEGGVPQGAFEGSKLMKTFALTVAVLALGLSACTKHDADDTANVLLVQLLGHKRVLLVSPEQTPLLYNTSGVFSQVDPESPDATRHPAKHGLDIIRLVAPTTGDDRLPVVLHA